MARIDNVLKLYVETIQSPYLHYGYWENPGEVNVQTLALGDVIEAQQQYIDYLATFIPDGVEIILDVGCGIGGNTAFLRQKGYHVEGLTPDAYQAGVFRERLDSSIPFHLSKFESFESDKTYHLILMSESASYIKIGEGAGKASELLGAGGWWLVSDYFIADSDGTDSPHLKSAHHLDKYVSTAQEAGFDLLEQTDITENVMPTLDAVNHFYHRFVAPIAEYVVTSLGKNAPKLKALLEWRYGDKVREKVKQLDYLDSNEFRKYRRYMVLLFQKRSE